jgi:hypothetical protein
MSKILKSKSTREGNYKLVGASMHLQYSSYLSLYAKVKNINKSDVLRKLIMKWHDSQMLENPERVLVEQMTSRVRTRCIEEMMKPGFVLDDFINQVTEELLNFGIVKKTVNEILKPIRWHELSSHKNR